MNDDLRKKMLIALPHLQFCMEEARKEGKAEIGILAVKGDGNGRILARFDAEEFMEDLVKLLDAPPLSEEQRQEARAERFLSMHGLKNRA